MNDTFKIIINSPLDIIQIEDSNSVEIDTDQGRYQFLADHFNFAINSKIGECTITSDKNSVTYSIFNASIYFDNDKNTLFVYCIDFWLKNKNITNFKDILEIYKKSHNTLNDQNRSSKFKLNFSEKYNISLDIEDFDKI